jgi:hypothetical protein
VRVFLGVGWECAHLVRQPLTGLLHQPWMMMMNVERSVEWELAEEIEVLVENVL